MVQPQKHNSKNFAIELRKGGYSYSEIRKYVSVPKSTLSYWFRGLKLSEPQVKRLKEKRIQAAQKGSRTRSAKISKAIEAIQRTSAKDIGKISKRELWLMGLVLFWKNKNENDVKKGVRFTSSNPHLTVLFIRWLIDAGGIKNEEIDFDIFIGKRNQLNESIDYWAGITGFPKNSFSRYYLIKVKSPGLLRIRVKASSMLARQIAGWISGIKI